MLRSAGDRLRVIGAEEYGALLLIWATYMTGLRVCEGESPASAWASGWAHREGPTGGAPLDNPVRDPR